MPSYRQDLRAHTDKEPGMATHTRSLYFHGAAKTPPDSLNLAGRGRSLISFRIQGGRYRLFPFTQESWPPSCSNIPVV